MPNACAFAVIEHRPEHPQNTRFPAKYEYAKYAEYDENAEYAAYAEYTEYASYAEYEWP